MAMTLLEASKINSGDVKKSGIIETFAENSDILRVMPFEDIPGGSLSYNVEDSLPGVAFRGINESYTGSEGVVNPETEVLKIAGGDLDVDMALMKTRGEGIRTTHELMKVKALSMNITKNFIKGDSSSDPREFDGLQVRLTGSQLIAAGATSGGDALSLSKLDELVDAVDEPNALVMSKAMRRRLSQAARNTSVGGDIRWELDAFGRQSAFYADLPILIADYDETGARILPFTEANPGGGAAASTSIYCLSFGEEKCTGLQNGVMDVRDLGEIDSSPVMRTRVEWLIGMAIMHPRAAARLNGIKDAAVVA